MFTITSFLHVCKSFEHSARQHTATLLTRSHLRNHHVEPRASNTIISHNVNFIGTRRLTQSLLIAEPYNSRLPCARVVWKTSVRYRGPALRNELAQPTSYELLDFLWLPNKEPKRPASFFAEVPREASPADDWRTAAWSTVG